MKVLRFVAVLAALVVMASVGLVSVRSLEEHYAVIDLCAQVEVGLYDRALRDSKGLVGLSEPGRIAAECRCDAQLATGASAECEAELSALAFDPELRDEGWAPRRDLSVHLVQTLRGQGRTAEAAELAARAVRLFRGDADLFYLELVTRVGVEDEKDVLDELEARVDSANPGAARKLVSLANRHLLRGDPKRAISVLGSPPAVDDPAHTRWYETLGMAFATAGDLEGLRRTFETWRASGDPPDAELDARYAITLSISGLVDPAKSHLALLEGALAHAEKIDDPEVHEALIIRTILTRTVSGETERALALFDASRARFALAGLERAELERSSAHHLLAASGERAATGNLAFRLPDGSADATLFVSPGPDAPLDAGYVRHAIGSGRPALLTRRSGIAPVRWVLRDGDDFVIGSGTANPRPGLSHTVAIEPRDAAPPGVAAALTHEPRAPDGRPRVALILLDCADWRIVQYLRTRRELPTFDHLLTSGFRAVLDSDPPLTAVALESLVWPGTPMAPSFVGVMHQMGTELAGLSSVGRNPLARLAWLLPERPGLFAVVGAENRRAANLLFSHGGIRAGRHGEISGPNGASSELALPTSARDLHAGERTRWPALAAVTRERDIVHLRTIAAEFDSAVSILAANDIDLLALRIEPLDILTHAHFAETVREGQDDGDRLLFEVYRYVDARLAEISASLDDDDVLIVMSDHGIRTAMEHDRPALFVASGARIPSGRAAGTPRLRGVPRVLADLLGVATEWPDEGIAPFATRRVPAEPQ
ncbi:MAG: alkaline phosphatase family protein [Myxococcales bacterium]|nr:alkaline phosphatase family protein [Myxococcales bacterium]